MGISQTDAKIVNSSMYDVRKIIAGQNLSGKN